MSHDGPVPPYHQTERTPMSETVTDPTARWICIRCDRTGVAISRARAEAEHGVLSPKCGYLPVWKPASPPSSSVGSPEGMTEPWWKREHSEGERIAGVIRELRMHSPRDTSRVCAQALNLIQDLLAGSLARSETARLGEALLAAIPDEIDGAALCIAPSGAAWIARHSGSGPTDATRHLASLLASSSQESAT